MTWHFQQMVFQLCDLDCGIRKKNIWAGKEQGGDHDRKGSTRRLEQPVKKCAVAVGAVHSGAWNGSSFLRRSSRLAAELLMLTIEMRQLESGLSRGLDQIPSTARLKQFSRKLGMGVALATLPPY